MAHTPWCGSGKLFLQSGQFTSTLKTSEDTSGTAGPLSISYNGTNTPWIGAVVDKLYLQSGQFTSTIKDSEAIGSIDTTPSGISWDGADTPWSGSEANKLYLQSGQFTSTIKTSEDIGAIDTSIVGISWDGTNTPWSGTGDDKLYLQSGQFTSTLKTSENINGVDTSIYGISYDGINTPWSGDDANKLYLQSGQFTSTVKTSQDISAWSTFPRGICTNDIDGRLGGQAYERSADNTITLGQSVSLNFIVNRSQSNTITFGQSVSQSGSIYNRSISVTITFGQSIQSEHVTGVDTPWAGEQSHKLFLQSGQFSSTLKTSHDVSSLAPSLAIGISWDGYNTPWSSDYVDKLYLQSGQFTSTLKTSQDINSIDINILGISSDYLNTPWIGGEADKLYLTSGQFTSTIKDSEAIGSIDIYPRDLSYDGINTPWTGLGDEKLYLQSGQFTSTLKTSEYIAGIETTPTGISWDGTNTPWCGANDDKLYLQSGQFTSTLKTSEYVGSIDNIVTAISNNNISGRLGYGIYERSVSNTISLGQNAIGNRTYTRSLTSEINLCQTHMIYVILAAVYIYTNQLEQSLLLDHQLVTTKIFGLPIAQICRLNLTRWIFASASKYFGDIATTNNLHYFVEGTDRRTSEYQKYIEFRLDGPHITQISKGLYKLDVEINILWSFNQDNENFHEPERLKGILMDAMQDICIYKFGDGPHDDDSLLGTLQLKQDRRTATRVNNFGQVRPDVRLMQGTVEGTYSMLHSC